MTTVLAREQRLLGVLVVFEYHRVNLASKLFSDRRKFHLNCDVKLFAPLTEFSFELIQLRLSNRFIPNQRASSVSDLDIVGLQ